MNSEINIIILSYTVIIISIIISVMVGFISFLIYKLKVVKTTKKEVRHKAYSN